MMKVAGFLLLGALIGTWAQKIRYDNYRVYRLIPTTNEQLIALRQLDNAPDFDFWKGPTLKNVSVDIMVPPHKVSEFTEFINDFQIQIESHISDVQRLIEQTTSQHKIFGFGWTSYHKLSEINEWLQDLAEKYPDKVTLVKGGRSYEGRDILGVKISFKSGNKGVFLEGGIHANEWIAPAVSTYIIHQLLNSQDPEVRDIAESYDWYIFPSCNPDGYEYTHTTDRMWRKTRQPYGECYGADPNRNWDFHWMDIGSNNDPCSKHFAGSSPFSEPETKSLSEYITSVAPNLVAYIALHSYSQILLLPYGVDNVDPVDNFEELMTIGKKAAENLALRYGTNYTVGRIPDVLYVASGISMDWVKSTFNIPITYTYELRDTGHYGYVLPPEQILPTAEETMDSLITVMQETKARGYK